MIFMQGSSSRKNTQENEFLLNEKEFHKSSQDVIFKIQFAIRVDIWEWP